MCTLYVRGTSRSHSESACYVHRSLPGSQPRLTGWHPRATERRADRDRPVCCKGLRDCVSLVEAPFARTRRRQRHRHEIRPLSTHVDGPAQACHLSAHAIGNPTPAIVLKRVYQRTGGASARHPCNGPHGTDEWWQRRAPPARVSGLCIVRRGMATAITLRMRQSRHSTPAQWTGRTSMPAEWCRADGTHPRKREFEYRAGGRARARECRRRRRDIHATAACTARHITSRSGDTPNQRCHDRAPCPISIANPSSARRPCARASFTNVVGPLRR